VPPGDGGGGGGGGGWFRWFGPWFGRRVLAYDPNAKTGPGGFGPANFVRGDDLFPYRIDFENDASATAPAQRVDVFDQLSADLDWDTFAFTDVGFGETILAVPLDSRHFRTAVLMHFNNHDFRVEIALDFDSQTGQALATFRSLDPLTNLPPDALTGFLPPEDGTGRGQGYFSYLVRPDAGLATGTAIRNVARIQFDFGEIIDTNQVAPHDPAQGTDANKEALVTIEAGTPSSSVQPLPTTSPATFTVTWSGTDDANGSGVASYDVYVSDNSGPFTLWRDAVTATSAPFTGQAGHAYDFFSVATDNVGHRQPTPGAGQSGTRVLTPDTTPPSSQVLSGPAFLNVTPFTVNWTGSDDPQGSGIAGYDVFVSDNGGPFRLWQDNTTQTSASFIGLDGHHYAFYSIATDNAGNSEASPPVADAEVTLDATAPASRVSPLPAVSPRTSFAVNWSGDDGAGAGVASFDVFVAVDGGAFTPWLTGTTQTSAAYPGAAGHQYAFYSVATDRVGNRQAAPGAAQAVTRIELPPPPPPSPPAGASARVMKTGRRFRVVATDPVSGQVRGTLGTFKNRPQVSYRDVNADGVLDILLTEKKGKRKRTRRYHGLTLALLPG
jgi:hypothetical protein